MIKRNKLTISAMNIKVQFYPLLNKSVFLNNNQNQVTF